MSIPSVILIAFGLGTDSFVLAVLAAMADSTLSPRRAIQGAFLFGITQALLLGLGWQLGIPLQQLLRGYEHWVACAVLIGVGLNITRQVFRSRFPQSVQPTPFRFFQMLSVSLATSVDALAVGVGLGLLRLSLLGTIFFIGGMTFFIALAGFWSGKAIRQVQWKWIHVTGGLALTIVGFRILLYHVP